MSLLDQLSSLCIPTGTTNYQSTFMSFGFDNQSISIMPSCQNNAIQKQQLQPSFKPKSQHVHNSQQKMIKLFDDEELKPGWRYAKTDKKPASEPKINLQSQKNLSQFTVEMPKKDNQEIFTRLTKTFHIFHTKLRKLNYEFFVRLEQYSKLVEKQNALKLSEQKKLKLEIIEKGLQKLAQTTEIISLKYFQPEYQESSFQVIRRDKIEAFQRIRAKFLINKKIQAIQKCSNKVIFRDFYGKLQQSHKRKIKIDLFYTILLGILRKETQKNLNFFLKSIQAQCSQVEKVESFHHIEYSSSSFQFTKQHFQPIIQQFHEIPIQTFASNLKQLNPIQLHLQKAANPGFRLQVSAHFSYPTFQQNIPLKLHPFKSHQEQINLNDCIDNGHLLMNHVKTNISFRQQLQNLTLSNINSKTTNSSVNSSMMAYDNFILPHFNSDQREDQDENRSTTMRKQSKASEEVIRIDQTLIKKARKSLVITKRKESANDVLSSCNQGLINSEKQKLSFEPKKPKSTKTSTSKIIGQTQQTNSDREVIKRMLDQLNKKFLCHDKTVQISLSNNKTTSASKKQHVVSSNKKVQRKKIKSQVAPINHFSQNNSKKNDTGKKSIQQKNYYIIDLVDKKEANQNQNKSKTKNSDNCFMSLTLNKTDNNIQNSNSHKTSMGRQVLTQNRMKQSRSQVTKIQSKNGSSHSQENQICKILSKYRSKKPSIPQCGMKIDLVTQKMNKALSVVSKDDRKINNRKFFNQSHNESGESNNSENDEKIFFSNKLVQSNLDFSSTKLKQSEDSYIRRRSSINYLSSQTDSTVNDYDNILPSNVFLKPQQQNEQEFIDLPKYTASRIPVQAINQSLDGSDYFSTWSQKPRFSDNPPFVSNGLISSISIDKKRKSFEKNKQDWDVMFKKQKDKFLKNGSANHIMAKRKSTLNEQVIDQIKQKIEHCLIFNQKDTNSTYISKTQSKHGQLSLSLNSNMGSVNKLEIKNKFSKNLVDQ